MGVNALMSRTHNDFDNVLALQLNMICLLSQKHCLLSDSATPFFAAMGVDKRIHVSLAMKGIQFNQLPTASSPPESGPCCLESKLRQFRLHQTTDVAILSTNQKMPNRPFEKWICCITGEFDGEKKVVSQFAMNSN